MGFVERGMVAALIQAFWLSSLPPAPARTDDEAWRLLIGAREDEWKAHRKAVLAVWGRYERELRIAWAKRKAWAEKGQEWRERALAAARAEQLIRAQEARVVAVEETRTPQTWRPAVVDSPPVGGSRTWKD